MIRFEAAYSRRPRMMTFEEEAVSIRIWKWTLGLAVAAVSVAAVAQTQNYPNRPVRLIVPFGAGGITDVLIRMMGDRLSQRLGQPFIVENRPGANGSIGAAVVAKSAPDGYTILPVGGSSYSPIFFKELPFDMMKDFTPISLFWVGGYLVLVNGELPVKTLQEFVAYAKANPGKLNYGSSGAPNLMMTELFLATAGIKVENVQFKGNAQAAQSLAANDVQLVLDPPVSHLGGIQSGRVKALAISTRERLPSLPNVPTLAESGYPTLNGIWNGGAWAPAGTPKEIIDRLNRELHAILAQSDVKERVLTTGAAVVQPSTPEGLRQFILDDWKFWADAAKISGFKAQ
jgi:tripartite-type tricarboxylate transporter receptor subunit TctC